MTALPDDAEAVVLGRAEVEGCAVAEEVEVDAGRLAEAAEEEAIEEVPAGADDDAGAAVPVRAAAGPEIAELLHAAVRTAANTVAAPAVDLFMIRTSAEYPAQWGRAC